MWALQCAVKADGLFIETPKMATSKATLDDRFEAYSIHRELIIDTLKAADVVVPLVAHGILTG